MSKWMRKEDVLKAVTTNLDRINNAENPGTFQGVAYDWLKEVETVEIDDNHNM